MKSNKKGSVLVFSLIVLSIVLSTALSITAVNVSNRKSAASTAQSVQSFQTADTATEKVMKAIYNGNSAGLYTNLSALYAAIKATPNSNPDAGPIIPDSTCPGVLNLAVAGGTAKVSFFDTNGASLSETDCTSTLWRDTLARVKVEGSGSAGGGAVRVIEVGIAPLSSMAWGENGSGQLGDGSLTDKSSPVSTIGGSKWEFVSAGGSHVLAVRSDGTLWAWGLNDHGQLGDGTVFTRTSPMQIGTETDWESVAAGDSHSLAIKTDHTLWVWGSGTDYRLGNNSEEDVLTPVKITRCRHNVFPGLIDCPVLWKTVSAGNNFSLAIQTDDSLWSWGSDVHGQLGRAGTSNRPRQICLSNGCGENWKVASAGVDYALAIRVNNRLYVWGSGAHYRLGNNSVNDVDTPALISDTVPSMVDARWQSVAAGENHALGIRSDGSNNGTLWSWGSNAEGQLGSGSTGGNDVQIPVQRGTDNNWQSVSTGSRHSLALKMNGTNQELWIWGNNGNGQLGNDDTSNVGTPDQIFGDWQIIEGGDTFSIGIRR